VNALHNVLAAVVPGGAVLDLQTVQPPPCIEAAGRAVCEIDAAAFFERADANELVMMAAVQDGMLTLEAEDRLDVLERWTSGAELVAELDSGQRGIAAAMRPIVLAIEGECLVRERCRTRRFRKPPG
jgi:hypothetical protein